MFYTSMRDRQGFVADWTVPMAQRFIPAVPTMSRHHAAGADTARGLLFTVLGEFVLPNGAVAWTSAFIDVLGRLGVEEKSTRQALTRTAEHGWLQAERVGRRTRWRLTASAERLLRDGTERIYGFTGPAREWDGRWLLVTARVPESDRPARHLLRTRLSWAGFGSPAPGVWISSHTDRVDEAERVLTEAGVFDDARIFRAEYAGGGELATMVGQAWDLETIEHSYQQFCRDFSATETSDALTRLIGLVHSWRRFPWVDPALPQELLPPEWSGGAAARLFARRHGEWAADARAEWLRLEQGSLRRSPATA
jgi:phenylacetic acid degradation operon negative regulatory protein